MSVQAIPQMQPLQSRSSNPIPQQKAQEQQSAETNSQALSNGIPQLMLMVHNLSRDIDQIKYAQNPQPQAGREEEHLRQLEEKKETLLEEINESLLKINRNEEWPERAKKIAQLEKCYLNDPEDHTYLHSKWDSYLKMLNQLLKESPDYYNEIQKFLERIEEFSPITKNYKILTQKVKKLIKAYNEKHYATESFLFEKMKAAAQEDYPLIIASKKDPFFSVPQKFRKMAIKLSNVKFIEWSEWFFGIAYEHKWKIFTATALLSTPEIISTIRSFALLVADQTPLNKKLMISALEIANLFSAALITLNGSIEFFCKGNKIGIFQLIAGTTIVLRDQTLVPGPNPFFRSVYMLSPLIVARLLFDHFIKNLKTPFSMLVN